MSSEPAPVEEPELSPQTITPIADPQDRPTQPTAQPAPWSTPGTWTITTDTGAALSGYLPEWAEDDPSENGIPLDLLPARLAGINHRTFFEGQIMAVTTPGPRGGDTDEDAVFEGSIDCNPYDPDPARRRPHATLQVCTDHSIPGLGPDDLARIAAQLRTQADHIDHDIRPALTAARADWATRHTT